MLLEILETKLLNDNFVLQIVQRTPIPQPESKEAPLTSVGRLGLTRIAQRFHNVRKLHSVFQVYGISSMEAQLHGIYLDHVEALQIHTS